MEPKVILLDIEGTTSSIEYVYKVLFPYVRESMREFLEANWGDATVRAACNKIAEESGDPLLGENIDLILTEILRLMDEDSKSTGLKELQGLVSKAGYEGGKLRAHFYPDVRDALERWTAAGITCAVYSSGSVAAQKNFYEYAEGGTMSKYISANFDTTIGGKRERRSYEAIAFQLKTPPEAILFCSDVVAELDAAREAGMQTVLLDRPGNKPVAPGHTHRVAESFVHV